MQILGLLGMCFDAVVVEVKTFLLLFRLVLAILCWLSIIIIWEWLCYYAYTCHFLYLGMETTLKEPSPDIVLASALKNEKKNEFIGWCIKFATGIEIEIFAVCAITFEPIKIQTCSSLQKTVWTSVLWNISKYYSAQKNMYNLFPFSWRFQGLDKKFRWFLTSSSKTYAIWLIYEDC